MLWVQGIKIINSRKVVFNEFEMPCIKHRVNKPKEFEIDRTLQSKVKLTRFSPSQSVNGEVESEAPSTEGNGSNSCGGEVQEPEPEPVN